MFCQSGTDFFLVRQRQRFVSRFELILFALTAYANIYFCIINLVDTQAVLLECAPFLLEVLITPVSLSHAGILSYCHYDLGDRKLAKQLARDRIYVAILLWSISSKRRGDVFAFELCGSRKLFFGSPAMMLAGHLLLVLG